MGQANIRSYQNHLLAVLLWLEPWVYLSHLVILLNSTRVLCRSCYSLSPDNPYLTHVVLSKFRTDCGVDTIYLNPLINHFVFGRPTDPF